MSVDNGIVLIYEQPNINILVIRDIGVYQQMIFISATYAYKQWGISGRNMFFLSNIMLESPCYYAGSFSSVTHKHLHLNYMDYFYIP